MDEIVDNVGGLSLNAKEWRPGGGQGITNVNSTKQQVASQSSIVGNDGSWGAAVAASEDATATTSLSSQVIDKNGTHYFGSNAIYNNSWEQRGGLNNDNDNKNHTTVNINTTMPSRHHPQNNHRTLLHTSSSTAALILNGSSNNSLYLPLEEYHHYRLLSNQSAQEMDPNDTRHKAVPPSFCHAYCLDDDTTPPSNNNKRHQQQQQQQQQRSSFGYPTSLFRVTSMSDGKLYVLRRIDSVRCVSHKIAQTVMHQWLSNINGRDDDTTTYNNNNNSNIIGGGFDHPGIVRWYKCFISQRAVFFIHHYHAGAVTVRERFFSHHRQGQLATSGVGGGGGVPLPEPLIWSCLTQLVSAIRAVHGNSLAVRTLQLNHILCTQENNTMSQNSSAGPYGLPKLRLRINCIGIVDILEFESRKGLEELQVMDMRSLGCILLSMTTGTEINSSDLYNNGGQHQHQQQEQILYEYMKFVQQNYSRELYMIVQSLLHSNSPPAKIQVVASTMAMRAFDELDDAYMCIDERHTSLSGIYESGRALRLLLKLAFVNERPEFGIDTSWSESGDCYILKLFRDFGVYTYFYIFQCPVALHD